jgi:hypothetical protein
MMRAVATPRTEVTIGRGTVALRQDELDRLLKALATLATQAAGDIADEIAALRVAGVRIQLLPTQDELAALRAAIAASVPKGQNAPSSLQRLKELCAS